MIDGLRVHATYASRTENWPNISAFKNKVTEIVIAVTRRVHCWNEIVGYYKLFNDKFVNCLTKIKRFLWRSMRVQANSARSPMFRITIVEKPRAQNCYKLDGMKWGDAILIPWKNTASAIATEISSTCWCVVIYRFGRSRSVLFLFNGHVSVVPPFLFCRTHISGAAICRCNECTVHQCRFVESTGGCDSLVTIGNVLKSRKTSRFFCCAYGNS